MVNKDHAALLLGIGATVVTLGVGTRSTNARIDEMNQRMTDGFANLQRQIDELQADVRELRSMQFETLKTEPAAN